MCANTQKERDLLLKPFNVTSCREYTINTMFVYSRSMFVCCNQMFCYSIHTMCECGQEQAIK